MGRGKRQGINKGEVCSLEKQAGGKGESGRVSTKKKGGELTRETKRREGGGATATSLSEQTTQRAHELPFTPRF